MRNRAKILFFGYSEIGYECLRFLLERDCRVVALVTHKDDPKENIWYQRPSSVARKFEVPVFTPESVNSPGWVEALSQFEPDLILSAYYRKMLPMKLLDIAPLGAFNMHGLLLPKFRGRAPLNWALVEGVAETGMTLHRMVERADAGGIVDQIAVPIDSADTALSLFRKMVPLARMILERQIDSLLAGTASERVQVESEATCFGARTPEDGRIDWTQSNQRICNLVRAVTRPYPGAFTDRRDVRLRIWRVSPKSDRNESRRQPGRVVSLSPFVISTGDGYLELEEFDWARRCRPSFAIPAPVLRIGESIDSKYSKWFK